ncbi:predicted protein [Histoplasma capsulatum H143]|uniref:Uncharacterized protein n=1 Tax=Ajellomyces capsulatus (strain H143) TaxID=544712 RepID=C6H4T7_AJECH|nr:predicted protein [Histoplasma capsulatum H143]
MPLRVNMTSSGQFPVSPCLPVLSQGDNMTNPRFIVVRETKGRRYSHGFASSNQRYLWRLQRLQRLQRLRYPEDCGFSNAADARLHDAFPKLEPNPNRGSFQKERAKACAAKSLAAHQSLSGRVRPGPCTRGER